MKCAFQSKPTSVAGISVDKHRNRTKLVFGAQSSAKPSTKLLPYFPGKIYRKPKSACGEGMRGTTNVPGTTGLNSTSIAIAVRSSKEPPKV